MADFTTLIITAIEADLEATYISRRRPESQTNEDNRLAALSRHYAAVSKLFELVDPEEGHRLLSAAYEARRADFEQAKLYPWQLGYKNYPGYRTPPHAFFGPDTIIIDGVFYPIGNVREVVPLVVQVLADRVALAHGAVVDDATAQEAEKAIARLWLYYGGTYDRIPPLIAAAQARLFQK